MRRTQSERVLDPGTHHPDWLSRPAGLIYIPVEHEGNIYESVEEEDKIADIIRDLLGLRLRRRDGAVRQVTSADILVVAPYNLQVRRLDRRLRPIRVGTVDKFQGQEASVVIFSMCASSRRLFAARHGIPLQPQPSKCCNLASETLAVVIGSPALVRTRCSSIEQIRLVNVYCRAVLEGSAAALTTAMAIG